MIIIRTVDELRALVAGWKNAGETVAVVPTMGALHEGHLSLVRRAKAECDRVIVTLFVNPRQFNNPEDLAKYPRTEDTDSKALSPLGADVLFVPAVEEVYPQGFSTGVTVTGLSEGLCGAHRPGHFDGVATVVSKLFLMTGAQRAFFGEKDWQQLQVVQRVVRDLNIPISVTGCETVREADGLAMSSRNLRLSDESRTRAPALYRAMQEAARHMHEGMDVGAALAQASDQIVEAGFSSVEYLELRSPHSLTPMQALDGEARLLAAAWLDGIRLIDNIAV